MPTLDWIGKDKVINHHLDVPFRVLDKQYSCPAEANSSNKIIHGDNLEALKSLLPEYEGKVKCIYIDPPYNTGNEGWVYNDNVNDPKIIKWLGDVVGKEGEDLTRHDKWLCMMYPRLKLLQKLLADDGAIFVSIGDDEVANLKLICNEIYGSTCFVSNIAWQRTYSPRNDSKGIPAEAEWLLVYSKKPQWNPNKLDRTIDMDARYTSPDKDQRAWASSDASAPGAATHTGMVYAIQHPITGKLIYPASNRHWKDGQDRVLSIMQGWGDYELREIDDFGTRSAICGNSASQIPQTIPAVLLTSPHSEVVANSRKRYDEGNWPLLYFTNNGKGGIRSKSYLDSVEGRIVTNLWSYSEVGHTDEASKELKAIFKQSPFETPKPSRLIERIIDIATDKDSIILDSFAGSGTTAHAVLNANKQDGGNRQFILIEMEDYAETITAERVRRVIDGYGNTEGTGGNFEYYELGEPLLIDNQYLNEAVPDEVIRSYIWYMETKESLPNVNYADGDYLLGKSNDTAYYFYYKKNAFTTLDATFLATLQTKAEGYVIYADQCAISDAELKRFGIVFKKIPRDITKL